jgi:uncharacterized membrane protein YeaQ/YmgE (transglycosylase-associated protein family)
MISWIFLAFFGLIIGMLVRFIHPGEEPSGCLPTIGIGITGSYIGGAINWALGNGNGPISTSGITMSIVGGVIFCYLYNYIKNKK